MWRYEASLVADAAAKAEARERARQEALQAEADRKAWLQRYRQSLDVALEAAAASGPPSLGLEMGLGSLPMASLPSPPPDCPCFPEAFALYDEALEELNNAYR